MHRSHLRENVGMPNKENCDSVMAFFQPMRGNNTSYRQVHRELTTLLFSMCPYSQQDPFSWPVIAPKRHTCIVPWDTGLRSKTSIFI
jgi:hypothetical protein